MQPGNSIRTCTSRCSPAIALGVVFGFVAPEQAAAMKPLGDGFIKLVKMLIAPIVFTTVVVGIAQMGAMKDVGRIGLRALVYFEVVSIARARHRPGRRHVLQPGSGVGFDPATADVSAVAAYTDAVAAACSTDRVPAEHHSRHRSSARSRGARCCRCCCSAVLFGLALLRLGDRARPPGRLIVALASDALFDVVGMIMRLAPIGAFGAMAFTVGRYGIGSLRRRSAS